MSSSTSTSIKTPADSHVIMTELVLPNDTNQLGNLLGGRLMHWIDIAAALVTMKHAGRVCVTASVDEINFFEPIRLGHIVTLYASLNRAFKTSLEVGVRTTRTDPSTGEEVYAGKAYLTFVAIDNYGKPIPVPPVRPVTPDECRRYDEAGLRREQRLRHREALKELRDKVHHRYEHQHKQHYPGSYPNDMTK
jgi:acyl-CoA hydrolase